MTKACKKAYTLFAAENSLLFLFETSLLKHMPCIHHQIQFKKKQAKI